MMNRRNFLLRTSTVAAVVAVPSLALSREADSYTHGPITFYDEPGRLHVIYYDNGTVKYDTLNADLGKDMPVAEQQLSKDDGKTWSDWEPF